MLRRFITNKRRKTGRINKMENKYQLEHIIDSYKEIANILEKVLKKEITPREAIDEGYKIYADSEIWRALEVCNYLEK